MLSRSGAKVLAYEPTPIAAAELIQRLGGNENLKFEQPAVTNAMGSVLDPNTLLFLLI